MQVRAIAAALLWLCLCAAAQETAAIHGTVINVQNGEPLGSVQVHLAVRHPNVGLISEYGALTGKDGRFSITGIRPGAYFPLVRHFGFVVMPGEEPVVTLAAGQHLEGLRIELTARAVISGRVTDDAGDPLANLLIRAESASGDEMTLLLNGGGAATTDDRGQYRMSIPPGKYRIKAQVRDFPSQGPEEIRTDGTIAGAQPDTSYPGVIETAAGRETSAIDIHVGHPVTLSLSGAVAGGVAATVNVNAHVHQGNTIYDIPATASGSFVIPRLEPGTYYLYAFNEGEPKMRSAVEEFTLTDTAISGIELALRPKFDVTGTLEMSAGAGSPANRAVRLEMMTGYYGDARIGTAASDGAFEVHSVDPERYRVAVRPLPENGYLKTVWLDRVVMPRGVLDLRKGGGGSKLRILIATDSAQVSGKLEGARGLEQVILLAEGEELSDRALSAQVASDGKFGFKSVPPGTYRLFALNPARALVKGVPEGVERLELKPNDRVVRNLKLLMEAGDGKK